MRFHLHTLLLLMQASTIMCLVRGVVQMRRFVTMYVFKIYFFIIRETESPLFWVFWGVVVLQDFSRIPMRQAHGHVFLWCTLHHTIFFIHHVGDTHFGVQKKEGKKEGGANEYKEQHGDSSNP